MRAVHGTCRLSLPVPRQNLIGNQVQSKLHFACSHEELGNRRAVILGYED